MSERQPPLSSEFSGSGQVDLDNTQAAEIKHIEEKIKTVDTAVAAANRYKNFFSLFINAASRLGKMIPWLKIPIAVANTLWAISKLSIKYLISMQTTQLDKITNKALRMAAQVFAVAVVAVAIVGIIALAVTAYFIPVVGTAILAGLLLYETVKQGSKLGKYAKDLGKFISKSVDFALACFSTFGAVLCLASVFAPPLMTVGVGILVLSVTTSLVKSIGTWSIKKMRQWWQGDKPQKTIENETAADSENMQANDKKSIAQEGHEYSSDNLKTSSASASMGHERAVETSRESSDAVIKDSLIQESTVESKTTTKQAHQAEKADPSTKKWVRSSALVFATLMTATSPVFATQEHDATSGQIGVDTAMVLNSRVEQTIQLADHRNRDKEPKLGHSDEPLHPEDRLTSAAAEHMTNTIEPDDTAAENNTPDSEADNMHPKHGL